MKIDMEKLKKIVGEKNVSDDIADLYVYGSDASVHHAMPSAVIRPKTIEDVQKIMNMQIQIRFLLSPEARALEHQGIQFQLMVALF